MEKRVTQFRHDSQNTMPLKVIAADALIYFVTEM